MRRLLVAVVAAMAVAMPSAAEAATQTFTTSQSVFPGSGGLRNQGQYHRDRTWQRNSYETGFSRGSRGTHASFFTFDVSTSCEAGSVTLRLTRFNESFGFSPARFLGGTLTLYDVTTPAAILNDPWIGGTFDTYLRNHSAALEDLGSGVSFGEFPFPAQGSPDDVLSFPLNAAGVAAFNAARGGFFSIGGDGSGTIFIGADTYRPWPIFSGSGASGTQEIVVKCATPRTKAECKHGGWRNFGDLFKNQGSCVSFVATGGKRKS